MRRLVIVLALVLLSLSAAPAPAGDLVLVLDASGSMWGQIQGENKIVIARRVLGDLVDGLEEGQQVALVAYGHRREGDCGDIETVAPLGPLDKAAVKAKVDALNPKGKTPITASLEEAIGLVKDREGAATVVLVSDGLETCGGDPCELVREARAAGVELVLHVVGFDVAKEDVSQLECAAQAGGGLFLSADNADELAAALETAVALPADEPAARLSIRATRDGELQDVAVHVNRSDTGEDVGGGRTYTDPSTNPRIVPLAAGRYDVKVQAAGLKGDIVRRFDGLEIGEGETVEREVDFSSGELVVGVTRNGELSDATVNVTVAGETRSVDGGRTYTSAAHNPSVHRLTAGTYDVEVVSVEISGKQRHRFEGVVVEPRGRAEVSHEFVSGTLALGVVRGRELVDATVQIYDSRGRAVDGGRTYTSATSNPKTFTLVPGDYRVEIREIRGDRKSVEVSVSEGEETRRMVDLDGEK